jgi:uncharacterized protein with GYD domain
MPHYIVLVNFTDQGMRNIENLRRDLASRDQQLATAGVNVQRFFTLGEYDIVAVVEAPDDEAMATVALRIGSAGDLRTTTLKAFTQDEFLHLMERLPRS